MSMQDVGTTELSTARWTRRREGRLLPVILLLLTHLMLLNPSETRAYGLESPGRRRLLARDVVQPEFSMSDRGSFSFTMLHRDHEQSPLRDSRAQNLTFTQRMKEAAQRSSLRTKSVREKIQMLVDNGVNGSSISHPRRAQLLGVRSPVCAQQGEYIVNINLGTPSQKLAAILDSGSDLAWVQCQPCTTCISTGPDSLFDPSASSSYQDLPCDSNFCTALPPPSVSCSGNTCPFIYEYGDGTNSSGEFATETITLESTSDGKPTAIPNFAFGCGTDNSGDLSGSDGVVGIGRGAFSLPSQLGAVAGTNIFSFCLVNMYDALTKTSPLMIGKNAFGSASGTMWTPIVKNEHSPTFYYVQMEGIKVNGKAVEGIPSNTFAIHSRGHGGTIMDTGTTITELLPAAYDILLANMKAEVPYPTVDGTDYGFDLCWDISSAPISGPVLPSISFHLSWSDFTLPTDNAYMEMDAGVICFSFDSGEGINIIGNVHLQNFHIFVNNDKGVLGWKPAQCDLI